MKYAIVVVSLLFAISANAQVSPHNLRTTVKFNGYSPTVLVEGSPSTRLTDNHTKTTTVDCTKNPELCNKEIDDKTDGQPSEPNDPSGPSEGGGGEPAEGGGEEGGGEEKTESGNSYNLPSEIVIESWTVGESKKPNRYCVWMRLDGKWELSKDPETLIIEAKKYILESAKR